MHLLNVHTHQLCQNAPQDCQYAILSHRWTGNEISFRNLTQSSLTLIPGLDEQQREKILGGCERAKEHNLHWIWIDSCCINREDAVELSESITSMFKWYQEAVVCVAYLADVESTGNHKGSAFARTTNPSEVSDWFSRGWTLQELLAPRKVRFYDRQWKSLGTREELGREIQSITRIQEPYLSGSKDVRFASIAARMSWMAGRRTTKPEDIAYSMLGLFGVSLTPRYGEGAMAFQRLQHAIMSSNADESIFAWSSLSTPLPKVLDQGWQEDEWGLVAPSPHHFRESGDIVYERSLASRRSGGGYSLHRDGVVFPMLPIEFGIFPRLRTSVALTLNCWQNDAHNRPRAIQVLLRKKDGGREFRRQRCSEVKVSSKKRPRSSGAAFGGADNSTRPLIVQPHPSIWV